MFLKTANYDLQLFIAFLLFTSNVSFFLRQWGYVFTCVGLSIRLTVCERNYWEATDQNFIKIYRMIGRKGPMN